MARTRSDKESLVTRYQEAFGKAPNLFLVDFTGLDVPGATELRSKLRREGAGYIVVKNTLVRRAIEGTALAGLEAHFDGPTAVAYSEKDPVGIAKVLREYFTEIPTFVIKGGLVEGRPVESGAIEEIATLPSRDELIAKLLFLVKSPLTNFVRLLGALPRELVVVLDQVRAKKEREGGG